MSVSRIATEQERLIANLEPALGRLAALFAEALQQVYPAPDVTSGPAASSSA